MMLQNNPDNTSKARETAAELVKRFAFNKPDEIIIEDIAMACGVLVAEGGIQGSEARLVRKNDKGIIRVRADIPEGGRKRFAVAHELGHWKLHSDISQFYLCSEADVRDYGGSAPEVEANVFAGELLMPGILFRPMCRSIEPSINLLKELAQTFGTSLTSTAVRFIEESRENCIVVFSENGKVKWWRAKEHSPETWIDSHQKIHQDSAAWECFRDGAMSTKMKRVPTEAWFQDLRHRRRFEVYEQSMKMGKYPLVLSLLWIIEE
ncbi:MAG: ImmA/IrrE family metallo-endopeptidase [Desulfuromonadaceae bacterium]|nr:ImmA/IrrE family metallo-endopeptidase [Desulfuromonadaceae bacterium]